MAQIHWQTVIAVAALGFARTVVSQGQCYFPPEIEGKLGFQATEQRACDAFAKVSLCCPLGWTCFSNHLCVVTDSRAVGDMWPLGTALRGTCTNPFWDDATCGSFCLDDPVLENNGSLQYCGGDNWCCGPAANAGSCNCQDNKGTFSLPAGEAQTIIGVEGLGSTSTFFTAASTSSTTPETSSTRSSIARTTSKVSSPSESTLKTSRSSTQSTISRPTSSSVPSTSQVSSTGSVSQKSVSVTEKTAFKAGIGVLGGLVGLALIAGIAFLIWRSRRNKRLANLPTGDDNSSIAPPSAALPSHMFRADPDPYAIAIPPRSPARGSPARGAPERTEMRNMSGSERMGRPLPRSEPYVMPYEGT